MCYIRKFFCDVVGDICDFAGFGYEATRWYLRGANAMIRR